MLATLHQGIEDVVAHTARIVVLRDRRIESIVPYANTSR